MKVYEATVIDKCAGAEPISYESHVAVPDNEIYYNDRQVLAAIANTLKEVSATLKEIARKES